MSAAKSGSATDAETPSIAVSVDGRIAEDRHCISCGYNLRGLNTDGRCPECGSPVADSLVGLSLEHAHLPWLRTVRRGFGWMKLAAAVWALFMIVLLVVVIATGALGSNTLDWVGEVIALLGTIVVAAATLAAAFGFLLATRVEPRRAARGEGLSARRLTRVLIALSVAGWIGFWIFRELAVGNAFTDAVIYWGRPILAAATAVAVGAFVQHVIGMLARTANEKTLKLAKQTRTIVIAVIILAVLAWGIPPVLPYVRQVKPEAVEPLSAVARGANAFQSCFTTVLVIGVLQLVWKTSNVFGRILAATEATARSPADSRSRPEKAGLSDNGA